MIAFMVISAVAFSAFMRYSRLPSSYLRRTSSARHLVHAALANAIDYIDLSIGNDPCPGMGDDGRDSTYPPSPHPDAYTCKRNYWRDGCFIGTNMLCEADETVSVLTLEALAYLPPGLINEARYYSRHTPTASWRKFSYDTGRYAFFAVDVSDCLNVNRVFADSGRNSSDNGRLSLAYAFENEGHTGYSLQPSSWDDFLDQYLDLDYVRGLKTSQDRTKLPFVSLADLNLAVARNGSSFQKYVSPFSDFIKNGVNLDNIGASAGAETMRNLNVVADGYYPSPTTSDNKNGDISREQPFTRIEKDRNGTQVPNREILSRAGTGPGRLLEEKMTALDMISLYDYLDGNDIPASLALPSVERVPMVCGLQPALKLVLKPTMTPGAETPDGPVAPDGSGWYKREDTYKLEVNGTGAMGTMCMFPFTRDTDVPRQNFILKTAVRIGFGIAHPSFRVKADSPYVVQGESDFAKLGVENLMMMPKVQEKPLNFNEVTTPADALKKVDQTLTLNEVKSWFDGQNLFTITYRFQKVVPPGSTGAAVKDAATETVVDAWVNEAFHPVDKDGTGNGGFTKELLMGGTGEVKVRPYMTITSRIEKNGKTVDLVPASCEDDKKYNMVNTDRNIANIGGGGANQPIMTFYGDKELSFSAAGFNGETVEVMIQPTSAQSVWCPDPRWNFAPENFLRTSDALTAGDGYISKLGLGKEGRDGDIFMGVSNQGYLQSVSELAYLPRTFVKALRGDQAPNSYRGQQIEGNCQFAFDFNRTEFEQAENGDSLNALNIPHGKLMWRTYRLYDYAETLDDDKTRRDELYDIGLFDGGRGPRVNPFAATENTILAALANTPYSWWAASTNNEDKALEELGAEQFNKNYAFNEMNNRAKFGWEDLRKVAKELMTTMRENRQGYWAGDPDDDMHENGGFDNHPDWCGRTSGHVFPGLTAFGNTDDLWEIDRKMLFGFWRDSFAAKQQLFMVFVRAEPAMMGGGVAGQTPPQLGGRAMALVWRNPGPGNVPDVQMALGVTPPNYTEPSAGVSGRPHRTRILFYRQFE